MEKNNHIKAYSFNQIKEELIGPIGEPERDMYEFELKMELIGEMIKKARLERKLTQAQLGELVGVQKAQISKLEKSANNVSVATILKVFSALKAKVKFSVELLNQEVELS